MKNRSNNPPCGILAAISISLMVAGAAVAEPTAYSVDPVQSEVRWTGEKVTGSHHGTLSVKNGEALIEDGKLTGGSFELAMNTIKDLDIDDPKFNKKLTDHLYSPDFFDVSTYPQSTFKITSVEVLPEASEGAANYSISGNLTIKGVSLPLTFPATIKIEGDVATAKAITKVDRTKYNVRYGSGKFFEDLGDKLIYDEFTVEIDLLAHRTAAAANQQH